jgi:hypothetical protein
MLFWTQVREAVTSYEEPPQRRPDRIAVLRGEQPDQRDYHNGLKNKVWPHADRIQERFEAFDEMERQFALKEGG